MDTKYKQTYNLNKDFGEINNRDSMNHKIFYLINKYDVC